MKPRNSASQGRPCPESRTGSTSHIINVKIGAGITPLSAPVPRVRMPRTCVQFLSLTTLGLMRSVPVCNGSANFAHDGPCLGGFRP